jgi:hypothetical protein
MYAKSDMLYKSVAAAVPVRPAKSGASSSANTYLPTVDLLAVLPKDWCTKAVKVYTSSFRENYMTNILHTIPVMGDSNKP